MLSIYNTPTKSEWKNICTRPSVDSKALHELMVEIFTRVELEGDAAVLDFSKRFDAASNEDFRISEEKLENLASAVDEDLKKAIIHAKKNIAKFHKAQKIETRFVEVEKGIDCWQKQVPIENIAIYIPGGSAPLFSTVLMLAVPAKIAGVKNLNLFTPLNAEGNIHPAIAYAAKIAGVTAVYSLGGAQAIAAAAIGTKQVPKADKIFGPGNQYVTAAKQYAQGLGIAIDMPAGPSEVLVWADDAANPAYVAADLLSQAEHGADSQCVLLCNSENFAKEVNLELQNQLELLPRKELAAKALENSFAVVTKDQLEQLRFSNFYAPEHLIIQRKNAEEMAEKVTNAGSVFIGDFSPESVGDYASGTNHTLPTAGYAKAYSGVNLSSYTKQITFQKLSKTALQNLSNTVVCMAENEGLQAHANAVKIRLQ